MNEIITTTEYNKKAHKKLYYYNLFTRSGSFYFIMLLVIFLAVLIINNTRKQEDQSMAYFYYAIVAMTVLLTPTLMIYRINSTIKKDAEDRKDRLETIIINKEKISRKIDGASPVVISWKNVEKIYELKDYFFFFINEDQSLIVDKSSFVSGDSQTLIRIIEKYGPKTKRGKSILKKLKEKKNAWFNRI